MQTIKFQTSYIEPYPLQVQGESNYRENIEDVTGYAGEDEGINADDFIANLLLEDDNIHDTNAVCVQIENKTVGYLPRPAAKTYRKKLAELGLENVVGECFASIKGGFIKRDGSQADFGVRLDIDLEELKVEPERIAKPAEPAIPQTNIKTEPITQPRKLASPKQPVKFGGKVSIIPMKGKGWVYWLVVFPIIGTINLYIFLFAGIWYAGKWVWDMAVSASKQ